MSTWFAKSFHKKSQHTPTKKVPRRDRSTALTVEPLESRLVPIVGAFGTPAVVGAGAGYDGVVQVFSPTNPDLTRFMGSGTLLNSGRHILTAAHLVDGVVDANGDGVPEDGDGNVDAGNYTVSFNMPWGVESYTVPAANISVPSGWNGNWDDGNDIAILRLDQIAPQGAQRFVPYSGHDEVGRWAYIVGYGRWGRGDTSGPIDTDGDGMTDRTGCDMNAPDGQKRIGANFFDGTDAPNDSRLELDFDSDTDNWAGGVDANPASSTDWTDEVMTAPGDSGGPSFLWGATGLEVAAVTSGGTVGSCLGDDMWSTRVSSFSTWINLQMAGNYDLVVDMNQQQSGSGDGSADTVEIRNTNGPSFLVEVRINGNVVYTDDFSRINSITVRGSNDNDTITYDTNGLHVPFTVDGRGGTNSLIVRGSSANETFTPTAGVISLSSTVFATTTINFSNVGSREVDGRLGTDTLVGPNLTNAWQITGAQFGTLNSSTTFRNMENLTGGTGADTFTVVDLSYVAGTIDGGNGTDTLVGPNRYITWSLNAANGGTFHNGLNNQIFSHMENVTGGTDIDEFILSSTGSLSGALSGGAGNDRYIFYSGYVIGSVAGGSGLDMMDYAGLTSGVSVNLTTGTASQVTGSVGGIEHVRGGSGNDTLVGNSDNNILVGNAGTDSLTGNNGRDVLIGGDGADNLNGGVGEDLLIAGWTSYDNSLTFLLAIMAEWGRTNANSDYWQRIANLRSGVGPSGNIKLVANTTVFDDMFVDTLTGDADSDWFWEQDRFYFRSPFLPPPPPRDTLVDWLTGEQIN